LECGDAKRNDFLSEHVLKALGSLRPSWKIMPLKAVHYHTRHNLERRGWAEFRVVPHEYMVGRLTRAGVEVRDMIDAERAKQINRRLKWKRKPAREHRKRLRELG
jgi:hypothetical protein